MEPRDRATFGGNTLLLIPDMTGVANPQNRELAGAVWLIKPRRTQALRDI